MVDPRALHRSGCVRWSWPAPGGDTGPFQRLALAVLVAAGVACAPLFAAVVAGLPLVYGRSLRVGEGAEVAGRVGPVKQVNLLFVVLEDPEGRPVRIPT